MPAVSVLMPTYQQAVYLPRALTSLFGQEFTDWELVVVDDGSRDMTAGILAGLDDPRVRVIRNERNEGLGAALNRATAAARGTYLAYLPSDDVMDRAHLGNAVRLLESRPEVYLAYAGLRWRRLLPGESVRKIVRSPGLRDDIAPGNEKDLLSLPVPDDAPLHSGNLLTFVQVVHRRDLEATVRWRERSEIVTDTLELDFWRGLMQGGAEFAYTGENSCEWGDHPDQHHKIVAGRDKASLDPTDLHHGISLYRQFYRVTDRRPLNWQPFASGAAVDERQQYGHLLKPRRHRSDGLRILLAGMLAFNPERIVAFEEAGHTLAGLWTPRPPYFETTGPLPFGNVKDIWYDEDWRTAVREFRPDVVYGLLHWEAMPVIQALLRERLDAPVVFHFKESPTLSIQLGHLPVLAEILDSSAGRIFISPENRQWFEFTLGRRFADDSTLILDGDYPKADWMTGEWAPKLSDADGEPHTACVGRAYLESIDEITANRIHLHLYGGTYHRMARGLLAKHRNSPYLHLHPTVTPGQWVSELSRYDAGWCHIFTSGNDGDVRRADWNDLNLPARLGTYSAAGLPWIFRDNAGHVVATQEQAKQFGIGIPYRDCAQLYELLTAERQSRAAHRAMVEARPQFTFDRHVPRLVEFFRSLR